MSSKAEMTQAAEVEYASEFDTALPLSDTDGHAVENSRYTIEHTNYVDVRESPGGIITEYMFRPENIRMEPDQEDFLIIGFDTEYKPLPRNLAVTNKEVEERKAKYEVLSYQFYARDPSGIEWSGIVVPDELERMTLTDFIVYIIGKGISEGKIESVARKIFLVGHYDRADLPAFDDRDILKRLKNVRNSMVTHGVPLTLKINFIRGGPRAERDEDVVLAIHIRDTILLAPATSRSLSDLGELVGCKKVVLSENREKARQIIQNMDKLRAENWDLFRTYALRDAEICVRYYCWLMEQYHAVMGTYQVPSALSGIVIKLLHRQWAEKCPPIDKHYAVGKEEQKILVWSDYLGRILTEKKVVNKEAISWHIDFVTECYHGGRAEQFWFGPSFTDNWSDYDLTSAYPTAMGLIGMPKWDEVYACTDLSHFTPDTLGYAYVDFKFPPHVRYPTMPVQTNHGILFPLEGRTHCSTPDIAVALDLGCEITIRHGVIIPADCHNPPFQDFLKYTIQRRSEATSDLEKGFWKEITNSCYGKTAQGLRKKRVFNLQRSKNEKIPESPITNPYYAAYITSFVRATVGELINRIPDDKIVFSVTVDGFVTNATDADIEAIQDGRMCQLFIRSRQVLAGDQKIVSKKHCARRLLGWKTRGQATLVKGTSTVKGVGNMVLAKAGIKPPMGYEVNEDQNTYIARLFFERGSETRITMDSHTSIRDMLLFNADLVLKKHDQLLNMEYDLKRRPFAVSEVDLGVDGRDYRHLVFSTAPWRSVSDFRLARGLFDRFIRPVEVSAPNTSPKAKRSRRRPVKTLETYRQYVEIADTQALMPVGKDRYMSKRNSADVRRLKRDLCRAFKQGKAGLAAYSTLTANEFASILNDCGFARLGQSISRADVENGKLSRAAFEPGTSPGTNDVNDIVARLTERLPEFDPTEIIGQGQSMTLLTPSLTQSCPFLQRAVTETGN